MKFNPLISLLFVSLLVTDVAIADSCDSHAALEIWAEEQFRIVGLDVSASKCPVNFVELRGGVSYYADTDFLYEGITASGRLRLGRAVSPYIGMGVLAGVGENESVADGDGIDNDGDGVIDERGEEMTVYGASAFVYPEAGIEIFSNGLGIKFSARKYYGLEFDGNLIISVGFVYGLGK
jgi:hypothetical protein